MVRDRAGAAWAGDDRLAARRHRQRHEATGGLCAGHGWRWVIRAGDFDLMLPRYDPVMRLLNPSPRRVRVRYTGYARPKSSRVMDSRTDEYGGRRGPELVAWLAEWFPNADIRIGLLRVQRPERPRCGARWRDGHACRAPAVWDAVRDRPVNGRCKLHGGLSTGPRTPEGKQRCADGRHAYWAARRAESKAPVQWHVGLSW